MSNPGSLRKKSALSEGKLLEENSWGKLLKRSRTPDLSGGGGGWGFALPETLKEASEENFEKGRSREQQIVFLFS